MTSSVAKKYTTTEYGKQNMFAAEPPMQYVENYEGYWKNAETTQWSPCDDWFLCSSS